jgi:hypothetical protein
LASAWPLLLGLVGGLLGTAIANHWGAAREEPTELSHPPTSGGDPTAIFAEWHRQFDSEPTDTTWSNSQTAIVGDAVQGRLGSEAHVIRTECRTTRCAVQIRFDGEQDAIRWSTQLVEGSCGLHCGAAMVVPPGAPDVAGYVGTLFFDCQREPAPN